MGSQLAFTGLVSEVGELGNAIIAHHQGRKGYGPTPEGIEKYNRDIRDAVADICIFLADFCHQEGIDIEQITMDTWNNIVRKRTIQTWEDHSHEKPPESKLEETVAQTGQGWAEPVEIGVDPSPSDPTQFTLNVEVWPVGTMEKAISIMKQAQAMLDGGPYTRVKNLVESFEKELTPWTQSKN